MTDESTETVSAKEAAAAKRAEGDREKVAELTAQLDAAETTIEALRNRVIDLEMEVVNGAAARIADSKRFQQQLGDMARAGLNEKVSNK